MIICAEQDPINELGHEIELSVPPHENNAFTHRQRLVIAHVPEIKRWCIEDNSPDAQNCLPEVISQHTIQTQFFFTQQIKTGKMITTNPNNP